jgi:hypothetical protein
VPFIFSVSAFGSAFVDNVIFVAAFSPVIEQLSVNIKDLPLWWALLFGACFGGNITMIGSTANIVALGMLEKHGGSQISFFQWFKIGLLCTILSGAIAIVALLFLAPHMPDHRLTFNKLSAESEYVPGDTVILGSYEQDNDLSNGPEPIEWQVIGTRDGHTLLLSKYALESKKYNEDYMEINWEDCTLRSWLNNDFYNTAFSASDRKRIVTAHNENPDSYELYKPWNKDSEVAGAVGGNATDDNVFLLSFEEVRDYLDGRLYNYKIGAENYNQKLLCRPTAYVKAHGVETYSNSDNIYPADTVGCCWWWLRSPGYAQDFAATVCDNGALSSRIVKYDADGVRPAILID